jgi:hypothetical protein
MSKKNICYRKEEGEHARVCLLYSRATTDECNKKARGKKKKKEAIVTGASKRTLSGTRKSSKKNFEKQKHTSIFKIIK